MAYKIKGDVAIDRNLTAQLVNAIDVVSNTVSSTTHNASLSTSFGYDEVAVDIVPATATVIVVDMTIANRKFEILIDNSSTGAVQINSPINSIDDKDHVIFRVTNNDVIARNVVFTALYTRPNGDQVGLFSMAAGESRVLKAIREGATMWVVTEDTAYVTPANARAFASNSGVAPVAAGYPSIVEIQTYVTANSITDTLVYYTGTNTFTDTPTHVYWIDQAGTATAVETAAEAVARPFGRMELTNNTATAALGVAVNAATIAVAANVPSVLPFSKISHQEGGMVGTLGTWTDGVAGGQTASGTRMSFTIPVGGAGDYRFSIVVANPIDGDIATGDAPSYGIAVNGSVAQVFDIKSGDGDVSSFTGLITLVAGDVVQPIVVIEGGQVEGWTLAVTFGTASLAAYPSVAGVDAVYSYFELEKRDPRDLVDPNLIVPTPLHYGHAGWPTLEAGSGARFTVASTSSSVVVAPVSSKFPFASANVKNATGTTIDNTNNQFVITQSGRYLITANATPRITNSSGGPQIVLNGTTILDAGQYNNGTPNIAAVGINVTWEGNLVAGNTIDARLWTASVNTQVLSANLTVTQLPNSTMVDPGLIVPTPLHRAYLHAYKSTTLFDNIQTCPASSGNSSTLVRPTANRLAFTAAGLTSAVLEQDVLGMTVGANTITATQAGTYSVDVSVTTTTAANTGDHTQLIKNGTIIVGQSSTHSPGNTLAQARTWIVQLAAGDTLDVRIADDSAGAVIIAQYSVAVVQLPVSTVIDPGLVPVNDQSSSGYFDIGGMRVQWGRTAAIPHGTVITFPAPFANANHSVQLTPISAYTGFMNAQAPTTTNFTVGLFTSVGGVFGGSFQFQWMAIGQKP